ncbi:MAG: hypothetical protein C5B55_10445 [Blastocatellia bacterium]|nr:MAG: hypothetical protein C5B55_10445 [Blastocatellia bacterium]
MQRRAVRAFSGFARQLFSAAFRVVVTSIVFTTCVVIVLRSMGVPMPSAHELLRQVEGLSKIAKIVS